MSKPLVSIITPTWLRNDILLSRCIPSVENQTYPAVEHVIVSDGPDPELRAKLFPPRVAGRSGRFFFELPEHSLDLHWGHFSRLHGLDYASGELIGYCDDDDALRPEHCALLAGALLDHPEAGWAWSLMASHNGDDATGEIGHGAPSCGNIGTPMIMHRRATLEHGTWEQASSFEDWELVNSWIQAGIGCVKVEEVTVDVWPSVYFGGKVR